MRLEDVIDAIKADSYLDVYEMTACSHIARILTRSAKRCRDRDGLPIGPLELRRMRRLLAILTVALDFANKEHPAFFHVVGDEP